MQTTTENTEIEHEWAVTDTQGQAMQCVVCGINIYFEDESWDSIDAPCPGRKEQV